jgi:hypothetical protein
MVFEHVRLVGKRLVLATGALVVVVAEKYSHWWVSGCEPRRHEGHEEEKIEQAGAGGAERNFVCLSSASSATSYF